MTAKNEFRRREAWFSEISLPVETCVAKCYENGFDARAGQWIIYFTSDMARMNPLSVLVPEEAIEAALEGDRVYLDERKLQIGHKAYQAGIPIENLQRSGQLDSVVLQQNQQRLLSNIKLFGRHSVVKDLVSGCKTQQNILSPVERLIVDFPPDLNLLKSWVGAGEGLTPSFDDFLAGMLLADRRSGRNCLEIPADFFAEIAGKTTAQSLQQLCFAAEGYLNLQTEVLVDKLMSCSVSSAEIVRVMHQGHSSGTDILCGIWYFLEHSGFFAR